MTREEAHRILSKGLVNAPSEHEWCMAFDMAIKALEQEPKTGHCENCDTCSKNHCGDALCFGNNYCNWQPKQAIPSAKPTLDSIRESIEEYVCNVETDTARAQRMLNAWRAIEYDEPLPSVEQKTGHWIEEIDDYGEIQGWHCDKCYEDSGFTTTCKWDYCPNCGARMVKPQESEDKG